MRIGVVTNICDTFKPSTIKLTKDIPNICFNRLKQIDPPDLIGFDDLIAVHLATHASMSQHKMRGKYRSAVYVKSDARADHARRIIAELAEQTGSAFVTAVLPFRAFKASDKRYQNYYDRNREGPFCAAYIEPKLALLRQRFAGLRREVGHVD